MPTSSCSASEIKPQQITEEEEDQVVEEVRPPLLTILFTFRMKFVSLEPNPPPNPWPKLESNRNPQSKLKSNAQSNEQRPSVRGKQTYSETQTHRTQDTGLTNGRLI